jgi:hypothetical protein
VFKVGTVDELTLFLLLQPLEALRVAGGHDRRLASAMNASSHLSN